MALNQMRRTFAMPKTTTANGISLCRLIASIPFWSCVRNKQNSIAWLLIFIFFLFFFSNIINFMSKSNEMRPKNKNSICLLSDRITINGQETTVYLRISSVCVIGKIFSLILSPRIISADEIAMSKCAEWPDRNVLNSNTIRENVKNCWICERNKHRKWCLRCDVSWCRLLWVKRRWSFSVSTEYKHPLYANPHRVRWKSGDFSDKSLS